MKQWITEEQFNELTDPQKEIWLQWCLDHHYSFQELYPYHTSITTEEKTILNFPSIGEMIEFLYENDWQNIELGEFIGDQYEPESSLNGFVISCLRGKSAGTWNVSESICDCLWYEVKNELCKMK